MIQSINDQDVSGQESTEYLYTGGISDLPGVLRILWKLTYMRVL